MTWMNELKEDDLDDIVHDAASAMASNANNEGPSGQVAFLLAVCGWTEEEIREQVLARKVDDRLAEKAAEIAEQSIEELPKQSSMGKVAGPPILVRRKADHALGAIWRASPLPEGGYYVSPNDGRVPSGQRINEESLWELFDPI